jgi:hypothetical protein
MCWYILVLTTNIYIVIPVLRGWGVQDTIVVVPPYPYSITEDIDDVPFKDCWCARPQLFFQCYMRPTGGRQPKHWSYKIGPDDLLFNLVFSARLRSLTCPSMDQWRTLK